MQEYIFRRLYLVFIEESEPLRVLCNQILPLIIIQGIVVELEKNTIRTILKQQNDFGGRPNDYFKCNNRIVEAG